MLSNFLAGLLAGVVTITYSLSYAVFIFSGGLSPYLAVGLLSALLGACVIALVVSFSSSLPFAIAGPDSNASALLALIAVSITQAIPPTFSELVLPTLWMAIALCATITGVVLFVLGQLRLGRLIRFIPYPVVGGFLAATGLLILQGSFKVMCGVPLTWSELDTILDFPGVYHAMAGVGFGLLLLFVVRKLNHFWVLPVMIVVGVGLFYGVLYLLGVPLAIARADGWLFEAMPTTSLNPWSGFAPHRVQWGVLLNQVTNLLAMIAVVAMTILLNASGLELATMSDADLDQELRAAGMANFFSGLFGGMVGYLSISRSLLNYEAGARSRLSGMIAAIVCMLFLVWGAQVLMFLPTPILGGLLCYLGLALLFEWLIDSRKRLSRFDHFLVILILLFASIWDFLTAVGLGTVIACLLFAFNYSRIRVVKHAMSCREHRSKVVRNLREQRTLEEEGERIGIFWLQGFIFFGTVSSLLQDLNERIRDQERANLGFLILDFRLVSGLDSSATLSFLKMKRMAQKHHFMLIFTGIEPETEARLRSNGFLVDADRWCRTFPDLDRGLEFCEDLLLLEISGNTASRSKSLTSQLTSAFDDPDTLPQLMRYMTRVSLSKGQMLFRQGDPADALYFVESGKLTVSLQLPGGRLKRLATIGPGTIVGEIGLFLERPRSASVMTEEPVCLFQLTREHLNKMKSDEPALVLAFQQAVIGMLSKRLIQANKELDILLK